MVENDNIHTTTEDEIQVQDVTPHDDASDPIPSSFVDRPLNSAPWQEGERPETEQNS